MQKKLIALAIAGLASSAAFAQSNVTIYGITDVGVLHESADGKSDGWRIDSGLLSGSRIGFKGSEDLGSGLKAIFTIEYFIQPDQNSALGAGSDWTGSLTRQSFVGLQGNWGTLVGGRLQGAGFNFVCASSPISGSAFDTMGKLGGETLLNCGSGGRYSNAVGYTSPNWNGFTFEYNHARVTEDATRGALNSKVSDSDANIARAAYSNGPLNAGLAYSDLNRAKVNGVYVGADVTEWGGYLNYDFGMVKLWGSYQDQSIDHVKSIAEGNKWQVSASIPVFKVGSVNIGYADFNSDVKNGDADSWNISYTHNLSKRTTLYAGYTEVSNSKANQRAIAGAAIGVPKMGGNADQVGFGMRHSF